MEQYEFNLNADVHVQLISINNFSYFIVFLMDRKKLSWRDVGSAPAVSFCLKLIPQVPYSNDFLNRWSVL